MKPKNRFQPNVGSSSILMIFVVLCLTTFGVLSYVTANADCKISTKNVETVQNYYAASAGAQKKLAQIDSALLTAKTDAEQAVQNPIFLVSRNDSLYHEVGAQLEPYLKGPAAKAQKLSVCYLAFAQAQLSRCDGVTMTPGEDGETLQAAFTEQADQNRKFQITLTLNPYENAERYKILNEKLIGTQSEEEDDTIQLWPGNSSQINP